MIKGISILLVFQCLGELIRAYTGTILPGPVIGMLLLFIGLCLVRTIPRALQDTSQSLIGIMPLMFLPATTGVFFLGDRFASQWLAIALALVVGTILSLVFNCWLMKRLVNQHD